jgi:hypothetical protein
MSDFTRNPTWFKGSSPRIAITTFDMLVWQDNSPNLRGEKVDVCRRNQRTLDELEQQILGTLALFSSAFYRKVLSLRIPDCRRV